MAMETCLASIAIVYFAASATDCSTMPVLYITLAARLVARSIRACLLFHARYAPTPNRVAPAMIAATVQMIFSPPRIISQFAPWSVFICSVSILTSFPMIEKSVPLVWMDLSAIILFFPQGLFFQGVPIPRQPPKVPFGACDIPFAWKFRANPQSVQCSLL